MNKYNYLLATLFLFPLSLIAGSFDFPQTITLDVNSYPFKVIAEDVNNDGEVDIITAGGEFISIHLNHGGGNFTRSDYPYQSSGQIGLDMCAVDIDNDNDIDLVFSNETSEYYAYLTFIINNGNGVFAPYEMANSFSGARPTDIDAADFDNDGFTDLVTADNWGSSLTIYFNNGAGNFDDTTKLNSSNQIFCVTPSDLDLDNDIDIAAATLSLNNLFIFKNNGDGSFADSVRYPSYFSSFSICSADLNNDTYPDLVTSIETGEYMGYMTVFLNNGAGEFNTMDIHYNRTMIAYEVIAADFDNDNFLDLAVVGYDNYLELYKNDQTGHFIRDTSYIVGNGVSSVSFGDFDNDGKVDLVTANRFDNTISVLLSTVEYNCCDKRGDVNNDNSLDVADIVYLVDYMFNDGPVFDCADEADVNASIVFDIADIVYFVDYMFNGGPPPLSCF